MRTGTDNADFRNATEQRRFIATRFAQRWFSFCTATTSPLCTCVSFVILGTASRAISDGLHKNAPISSEPLSLSRYFHVHRKHGSVHTPEARVGHVAYRVIGGYDDGCPPVDHTRRRC